MTTESELKKNIDKARLNLTCAEQELVEFRAKPKIKVYRNMPVIVYGKKRYASHLDDSGTLWYYPAGANSYTCIESKYSATEWQPDYDRPSLLSWRPVDETIPEHGKWLLKNNIGQIFFSSYGKRGILTHYNACVCLPLYEEK